MTPTSLRILKALAVGGVTSLVLVACGGGGGGGGATLASNQTLTFPILSDFGTLDPAVADAETDQEIQQNMFDGLVKFCLLYTSPSPRDLSTSRMPSSA